MVIYQATDAAATLGQVFCAQVDLQFLIEHAHGDLPSSVIVLKVKACPGPVHGDVTGQRAVVYDAHGKIGAFMAILPAVQYPLGCVPHGAADDGVVMVGLEILVLLSVVPLRFVVLIVGRVSFSGQHITAVLLIAQNGDDPAGCPMGVQGPVPAAAASWYGHLGQDLRHLLRRASVDESGVHPPHHAGFTFVDGQHLLLAAEAVRDLDLVIAKEARRQEAPSAKAPLKG